MTRLDEHLNDVEEMGFERGIFPLYYNEHEIWLLQNDARVTIDGRLQIHFTLYCGKCGRENILRGRAPPCLDWEPRHLQDIKVYALSAFVVNECGRKPAGV